MGSSFTKTNFHFPEANPTITFICNPILESSFIQIKLFSLKYLLSWNHGWFSIGYFGKVNEIIKLKN